MVIHDANLRFSTNQKPTLSLGASAFFYYPLPDTYPDAGGTPLLRDLNAVFDSGEGRQLIAQFDVKTTFTSGVTTTAAFGMVLSPTAALNAADLTECIYLPLSYSYPLASLVAGLSVTCPIPRIPSNAFITGIPSANTPTLGRRYVSLGMFVNTSAGLGVQLFTAGGVDAYIMLDGQPNELRQHLFTSGFTS